MGRAKKIRVYFSDEFYWLIENEEKQIDLYRMDAADTVVQIAANIGQSKRDPDKWTKLRKIVEKSEAYDQYLLQREKASRTVATRERKREKSIKALYRRTRPD